MSDRHEFRCPLPNGLHARPASLLAEVAERFAADVTLTNARSRTSADAKSVLALIALDVREGDPCLLEARGSDSSTAAAALRVFVDRELAGSDAPLETVSTGASAVIPRALREGGVVPIAGETACPGLGRGVVVRASKVPAAERVAGERARSREEESARVRSALGHLRSSLEARLAADPGLVEAAILRAHLAIARDQGLAQKLEERLVAGRSAGQAIADATEFFAARFAASESVYVRERALDVEDLGAQMLDALLGRDAERAGIALDRPSVLVAESLSPRELLAIDRSLLAALVLEHAGATSHAVILARSFGIPTLVGVAEARARLVAGREVVVDATLGLVIAEVDETVERYWGREHRREARRRERLSRVASAPVRTRDGTALEIAANVATTDELAPAFGHGADGIGLFRTEMLFLERETPPSEEEQLALYREAARAARGRPVIVRTFDVGGDKQVPYLGLAREPNPFLGRRGVRVYPAHRELFRAQLRAILRASVDGPLSVMVPMVSTLEELRWVRAELDLARAELSERGAAFDPALRLGIMIEVPSAALLVDKLARESDFFSIGTNDLAQYFFAADREGAKDAACCDPLHPSFLRLLESIVAAARREKRWIGVCGEMARSTRSLPLLVGLGVDEISCAAPAIPALKAAAAELSARDCRALLAQALDLSSTAEVEALLAAFERSPSASPLLAPELVSIDARAADKTEVIEALVDALDAAGRSRDPHALEDAVWARETVYSTGLGHGFAIPHCKTDSVAQGSIALVRLAEPVAWGSLDGEPVRCAILLALRADEPPATHMRVFSKLARKLMHTEFRERLLSAPDAGAVVATLEAELEIGAARIIG